MINISSIIAGIVAQFLDKLKISSPRLFAIIGAVVIALEAAILSGVSPITAKIPVVALEIFVAIVGLFANSRSFTLATTIPSTTESFGDFVNRQIAVLVEKFKTSSLTGFAAIQSVLIGFKFYLTSDTTLTWDLTLINGILSAILFFTAPKTRAIVAGDSSVSKAKWQ